MNLEDKDLEIMEGIEVHGVSSVVIWIRLFKTDNENVGGFASIAIGQGRMAFMWIWSAMQIRLHTQLRYICLTNHQSFIKQFQ
jgi:hypothetical protein